MTPSFRDPRPAPEGSPAVVYPELAKGRAYLDRLRVHHVDIARRFLDEAGGALYMLDLILATVTARSYSLVEGFIHAFDTWNPIVAAPVIRLQLDSLVRVAYIAALDDADVVARHIIGGGEFRNLHDSENKRLSDARLVWHAQTAHPWIKGVYEATSGWVHFSPEHIRAAWRASEDESREIHMGIPIPREHIPLSALSGLLGAITQATEELFGYLEIWESRKGLPSGETRDISSKPARAVPPSRAHPRRRNRRLAGVSESRMRLSTRV
jgi:hypothetical protein